LSGSDFVVLTDGPTVPLAALQLAWQLEDKGCTMRIDGDVLVVGPRDRLTEDDRAAIRHWRDHLRAIAAYEPPAVQ
jgi:hypothetical protein